MDRIGWVVVVFTTLPLLAGGPGEPLGCDDMVILEPELRCEEAVRPCGDGGVRLACFDLPALEIDNEGNLYSWTRTQLDPCGQGEMFRYDLIRFDGDTESVVATIEDRCVSPKTSRREEISFPGLRFDGVSGKLYFAAANLCREGNLPCDGEPWDTAFEYWLGSIEGFPTLVEILKEEIAPESLSDKP